MPEPTSSPASVDDLQFSTVESADVNSPAALSGKNCAACGRPIVSKYFAVGQQVVCPTCCAQLNAPAGGNMLARFVKATLLGIGGGLLGAAVWFAVRRYAHMEAGIVAVLVGFLVGKAVHTGSERRGGIGYQILAVVVTYCCIAANYVPDIIESMMEDAREQRAVVAQPNDGNEAGAVADGAKSPRSEVGVGSGVASIAPMFVVAFGFALKLPFLQGAQNIIGLLIIGFALWQAWKLNARRQLPISGPYELAPAPAA